MNSDIECPDCKTSNLRVHDTGHYICNDCSCEVDSDMENKEELLALTTCSVCGSDSATSNQIDINKHMRKIESELATLKATSKVALRVAKQSGASIAAYNCKITKELETLKATGFNVQDVVDWAKNTIHHKSKCGSHDCIYVDELINYLNQLPQATDNKDGEEND